MHHVCHHELFAFDDTQRWHHPVESLHEHLSKPRVIQRILEHVEQPYLTDLKCNVRCMSCTVSSSSSRCRDTDVFLIDVGFGFHVEAKYEEALELLDKKDKVFIRQLNKLNERRQSLEQLIQSS